MAMIRLRLSPICAISFLILFGCASHHHRSDGWYPVADSPDNSIVGKPLATVKDFDNLSIFREAAINQDGDTIHLFYIQGRVKQSKRKQWADGTERLIGHRLGFLYNDSIITSPQINARIESGNFQITSPDTTLLHNIYQAISR